VLRVVVIGLALVACGDNIDETGQSHDLGDLITEWLTSKGAVRGTVYRCESGAMCADKDGEPATEEWCYREDSERELEKLLGAACHEIEVTERAWPALAGCAYACPLEGQGANAHCGAFCPPPEES
jgi:hypothetical protein